MRLRDFGTLEGLLRVLGGLVADTVRQPWRVVVNLAALVVVGFITLAAIMAKAPWLLAGLVELAAWLFGAPAP
ncbi:hypothetical protein [Falsiroseomonas ponticola]|uniref:hypothetical protein n=1 Tax=Falsiroseomonas ponticola TaxID=2786951 RepID=UPI00193328FB|nr:hypothetical protein [Roseomonas ponticola]